MSLRGSEQDKSPTWLPQEEDAIFHDSSYFKLNGSSSCLPTPPEVRQAAHHHSLRERHPCRPTLVTFPSLNLLVKYGTQLSIAEGQCLWAIRRLLASQVPVPEVYGWCRDGKEVYIYMELVHGQTLESRWNTFSQAEKESLCAELRQMVSSLRSLRQNAGETFIGNINRGPLLDVLFERGMATGTGPFPSVTAFHDWFSNLALRKPLEATKPHHMRSLLPDTVPVFFTHGDLHRVNILVSAPGQGPPHILAIVDWHQSGWYPAYWEYCKASYSAPLNEDWHDHYLPEIFKPFGQCVLAWEDIQFSLI